jgi:hypothetical protein
MDATQKKRKKRKYNKKRLLTTDELWKIIIPTLWAPFLRFCMEDWVDRIDFTREPDFLDKELKRLMPRGKAKNRVADVLMRVYLKNGESKIFLLHIEVQGYFDPNFERRLYQYYYRISDFLQEPIETLAILIDDDPEYRPQEYRQVLGQTELSLKFRMFKLLDNPPPYLGKDDNPFSVVFEVAWYGIEQNMLTDDDDLMTLKFRLIKRLLENKTEDHVIYALLDFINIYLPFENSKKEAIFDRKIDLLIEKDHDMEATTIRELYIKRVHEKELKITQKLNKAIKLQQEEARMRQEEARMRQEEARMRQEEAQKHKEQLKTIVQSLYNQGNSVEKIAAIMSVSVESVQLIINNGKLSGL